MSSEAEIFHLLGWRIIDVFMDEFMLVVCGTCGYILVFKRNDSCALP